MSGMPTFPATPKSSTTAFFPSESARNAAVQSNPLMTPSQKKESNDKFIKSFKKASGQKTQTVLPSAVTANNEWAIKNDWSIVDAMHWRALCEKAKFARDDIEGESYLELLIDTVEMAAHCESHPIGLINFARTQFGAKTWDIDVLHMLKDNLLVDDQEGGSSEHPEVDVDDEEASGDGKKRRRLFPLDDASQPFAEDD